jgi:hypothetical protein
VIPDEAVEAGAKVIFKVAVDFAEEDYLWCEMTEGSHEKFKAHARAALEAAAPHMQPDDSCCCGDCGL